MKMWAERTHKKRVNSFLETELMGLGDYVVVRCDNEGEVWTTAAFTSGMEIASKSKIVKITTYGVIFTGQDLCVLNIKYIIYRR